MSKKLVRLYTLPDSDMLVSADTTQASYQEDHLEFERLNPKKFTPDCGVVSLTEINEARAIPHDGVVVDETAKETEDVTNQMEECRKHFKNLKYYIETAFPDNQVVWNQFGYKDYEAARDNHGKMIQFMDSLFNAALKYKPALLDNNYPAEKIDRIKTVADLLRKEKVEQQDAKKARPVQTVERITKLNQVWSRMVEINAAAKNIYKDQPAKLKQYQLPASPKPTAKPEDQNKK